VSTESVQTGPHLRRTYHTAHGDLVSGGRCLIMGVLNVTPDSFSDRGAYLDPAAAVERALAMAADGADVIDIGAESTRPGAKPISEQRQIERAIPVLTQARGCGLSLPISIDTRSARVARAALDAGADMINDVSAARHDPQMPRLLAECKAPFVIMHMQGTPETMQAAPHYEDVVVEVATFFEQRADALSALGVDVSTRMLIDPGIGFGKTLEHNLALLRAAADYGRRWPVVLGPSRKRFLGEILDETDPGNRIFGTAAVVAHAALAGIAMVRVHDVKAMRQVVDVCDRLK
jgi:dihydropteroate synthase